MWFEGIGDYLSWDAYMTDMMLGARNINPDKPKHGTIHIVDNTHKNKNRTSTTQTNKSDDTLSPSEAQEVLKLIKQLLTFIPEDEKEYWALVTQEGMIIRTGKMVSLQEAWEKLYPNDDINFHNRYTVRVKAESDKRKEYTKMEETTRVPEVYGTPTNILDELATNLANKAYANRHYRAANLLWTVANLALPLMLGMMFYLVFSLMLGCGVSFVFIQIPCIVYAIPMALLSRLSNTKKIYNIDYEEPTSRANLTSAKVSLIAIMAALLLASVLLVKSIGL